MEENMEVSGNEILAADSPADQLGKAPEQFMVWFGIMLVLVVVLVAVNSSFFALRQVVVVGNRSIAAATIVRASRLARHQNLLTINRPLIAAAIQSNPFIAGVRIVPDFPGRLVITVRERQPVCLIKQGSVFHLLGNDLAVMGVAPAGNFANLPVVTGVRLRPTPRGLALPPAEVALVRELIKFSALPKPDWTIRRIDLGRAVLVLGVLENSRTIKVWLGDRERLKEKFAQLRAVLAGNHFGDIISIDLRLPGISTVTTLRNKIH